MLNCMPHHDMNGISPRVRSAWRIAPADRVKRTALYVCDARATLQASLSANLGILRDVATNRRMGRLHLTYVDLRFVALPETGRAGQHIGGHHRRCVVFWAALNHRNVPRGQTPHTIGSTTSFLCAHQA